MKEVKIKYFERCLEFQMHTKFGSIDLLWPILLRRCAEGFPTCCEL